MIDRDELGAWLRLLEAPGLGRASARRLLAAFGSPQAVIDAPARSRREVARLAEEFIALGHTVVGCDLNPDTSAETVRLVRAAGGTMTASAPVDLSSFEATTTRSTSAAPM